MDEQENQEQVAIEPEKKRRGRPAKTIQSGVTVIDTVTPQNVEVQGTEITITEKAFNDLKKEIDQEKKIKKKRGRKPKVIFSGKDITDIVGSLPKVKKQRKQRVVKKKTIHRKSRKSTGKGFNILSIISGFKMHKIKINLSGIKLPKGLTWHDIQIWSVAMAAIIAIALAK